MFQNLKMSQLDRDELKLHRKDEHNVRTQTRIHKCTFCSKEFKGINELWNHNKDEHNSPFIKCEECDQTFRLGFCEKKILLNYRVSHSIPEKVILLW